MDFKTFVDHVEALADKPEQADEITEQLAKALWQLLVDDRKQQTKEKQQCNS